MYKRLTKGKILHREDTARRLIFANIPHAHLIHDDLIMVASYEA